MAFEGHEALSAATLTSLTKPFVHHGVLQI